MRLFYFFGVLAAGGLLTLGAPAPARAQAPSGSGATSSRWLLKAGLGLTRLRYDRTAATWQVLLPMSFGLERQLNSRYSLYGQFDTDCQLGSAARRGRGAGRLNTALPTVIAGLGSRFYYGQVAHSLSEQAGLGRYLALETGVTFERMAPTSHTALAGRSVLTPSLYLLWGTQRRARPHLLYDLNAGLGVLAPAHISGEALPINHIWDAGVQANLRLYWAR